MAASVPAYCPTCRGIMRPERGTLVCIRCSQAGRARTVMAAGRRISLGAGQQGLGTASAAASAFDAPLTPQAPQWRGRPQGTPHPQLGLFPFDEIRDGQRRLTRDVTLAVQAGSHLVAHAPTGLGKTAASLAPALQHALAAGKTVMFLTSRQSQHRIAVETLRAIEASRGARFTLVDLVAKRDMCLRHEAADLHPARFPDFCARETRTKACPYLGEADGPTIQKVRDGVLHVEELMHVSKQAGLCPHIVALRAAKEAHVVVADYNHLFSDLREQSLERLGRSLGDLILIVDEAHNLPDRIRSAHSHRITPFLLDMAESEARGERIPEAEADIQALRRALAALAAKAQASGAAQPARLGADDARVARLEVEDLEAAFAAERNRGTLGLHRTLADAGLSLKSLAAKAKKGADDVVHSEGLLKAVEDWGRFRQGALRFLRWEAGGTAELHIRLLDPSVPARQVFDAVHAAVLMSGTLRPPEMVRDLLGLAPGRTAVRSYPSPFPPQNRLVVAAQGYSTRYQERDPALWARIARTLVATAAATRGNLAVFAPSYAILRDLREALSAAGLAKPTIVEEPGWPKSERDRVLDTLEGERRRSGAVLLGVIGGSFAEGVDFRDNLLSVVAVVGLPLAPPDLEVQATMEYLDRRFPGLGRAYGYHYPAMNKVLQAMGRAIRGPGDRCAILLLDERFLGPPYRGLLPEGVAGAPEPADAVAPFLRAHGL